MKRLLKLTTAMAIVCIIAGAIWWFLMPGWPEFPAAKENEPQVVTKVDLDYAHHIGDLIEVDLYVRQEAGTVVDSKSLSIGGDFELAAKPKVTQKELADGSIAYRFALQVQCFKVKPEQVLNGSIGWSAGDKRMDLTIGPLSLFWSNTYDGRKKLMEGENPRVPLYWYTLRHAAPLAIASLIFLALIVVAFRRFLRAAIKPKVVDYQHARVLELLTLVENGACTKAQHLELDGLIRDHFKVGPIPASALTTMSLVPILVEFLRANEPAVYAEDVLDATGQNAVSVLGRGVLHRW